jgi:mono/diheme cytochrome c family protein
VATGWVFAFLALALTRGMAGSPARTTAKPARQGAARDAMLLLKAECFSCHNEEKKKGGLTLTSREMLFKGGENGPVLLPGKPESSLLAKVLVPEADPHMPPKKQLTDAQVKIVRAWIGGGANWDASALAEDEAAVAPVTLAALPGSYRPVMALALAPSGKFLAVARGDTVWMHDLTATNFPVRAQMKTGREAVQALAWSGDGRWLASAGFRHLFLWNGDTFQLEREWSAGLVGNVTSMKFTPDNRTLAFADSVAGQGGTIRLVRPGDGTVIGAWRAHADTVFDMDFSRDGKQLVTAGGDKWIKVWDIASKKETARLEGHAAQVLGVAFNTNATQVVSGGADRQLNVWDIATREKAIALGNQSAAVTSVAWPGDGAVILATTDAGGVFTYKNLKTHSGEQSSASGDESRIGDAGDAVFCAATTADVGKVFAGTHDGFVHIWKSDGTRIARLDPPAFQAGAPVAVENPRVARTNNSKSPERARGGVMAHPRPVNAAKTNAPALRLAAADVVALSVEPKEISLSADAPRHGVLVTARMADGFEADVTDLAEFTLDRSAPFELGGRGELHALRPGSGLLHVRFGRHRSEVSVKVEGGGESLVAAPASFVRDVLPALSRAGCNSGGCHAKAEGQNGFKLSVFSYDPKHDYGEIVKDARGRRVFPAAPDESLLIQKPSGALPHEGGVRFERGSETHRLLVRWMREGMAFAATNEPPLVEIVMSPKQRRYHKGGAQRLRVEARYADGSVRDVTRLAAFSSNDKEIATVDEHGRMDIGTLTGQGVIVARYMGFVADSQILVPADRLLPEAQYAALPRNNFIDGLAYAQFQRLGLLPSELCSDAEFLRRAKLDAIGLLPTPEEVRAFLADTSPDKRRKFVAGLLDDPAYADYWANRWADLLRPNPDRVGVKSVLTLDQWLRRSFRENKPYDQFVREILLAEGTNHRDGPAVIYRDRREPPDLTTMFSQLFLGTRFECARCHHHPNEKWSQDDFYQFAAFFGPVKQKGAGVSPPISAGTETFYFTPGGQVKHPITGQVLPPRAPDAPLVQIPEATDPRRTLADWLTSAENPFFARAAVNRVWAGFFGRGLVEPVDDFRISNPCVNPDLLSALAGDFMKHGCDLRHLIRTILESRLYQLSSTPNESNLADTKNFSRAYRRRLPAEVLLDAVNDATGIPDTFAATPPGTRATQTWSYKIDSQFLDAFNRPNPSSDPPCERERDSSVVQSLHLMNSKNLQSKLASSEGLAHRLVASGKPPGKIVTELYLATLSRPPSGDELNRATAAFAEKDAKIETATEDVFWALLNSAEFVFNH